MLYCFPVQLREVVAEMFKSPLARLVGTPIIAAALLLSAGCASLSPVKPEDAVQQRADAYWKARTAGQVEKAYELLSPSYRKLRTLEQYRGQFGSGAAITGASVVKVACEAERCTARMRLDAKPALLGVGLGTIATHLDEIWLLEDGQWWRHQDL